MLRVGDKAPSFMLPDRYGRSVSLEELLVNGALILFFYPADFTPVCTREVCLYRDTHRELAAAGISVAGVSPDDSDSHARFTDRHGLGFALLADPDKTVIRAYGVDGPLGIGVRRASFLIGADRSIRATVRADFRLDPHARLIREALST